jgi:hypothetical protein
MRPTDGNFSQKGNFFQKIFFKFFGHVTFLPGALKDPKPKISRDQKNLKKKYFYENKKKISFLGKVSVREFFYISPCFY